MRQDMWKVVTRSRPCGSRSYDAAKARVNDDRQPGEDAPQRESMKMRWSHGTKYGNFTLKPLVNYLRANVGRPWDEVFSDVCRSNNNGNYNQYKIRDWMLNLVELNVEIVDGQPHCDRGYQLLEGTLWVDPRSGLLCMMPYVKKKRHEYKPDGRYQQVKIDALHKYVLVNGCWFYVTFTKLPPFPYDATFPPYEDVVLKPYCGINAQNVNTWFYMQEWRANIRAIAKKQLSGEEIRRLKKRGVLPA